MAPCGSGVREPELLGLGGPKLFRPGRRYGISAPAISRHLRVLERARLIHRRRQGRVHFIRPRASGLKPAEDWISQCAAGWEFSFNALDELLQQEKKKEKRP